MGNVLPADCAGVQHGDFYAVLLKFFRAERNLAAFRRVLERVLQKVRDASHEQERVRLKVKILRAFLLHAEFYFFFSARSANRAETSSANFQAFTSVSAIFISGDSKRLKS